MRAWSLNRALIVAILSLGLACKSSPPPAPPEPRRVRPPAAAGQFYPADPGELQSEVRGFLGKATRTATAPVPMVLTPHAGLRFSGQVAAWAFKQLSPGFNRAVIVAGNHNSDARYAGVSCDRSTHYDVPGLEVKVAAANAELCSHHGFTDVPAAHSMHMIEIELPFLDAVNGAPFEIVPLVIGSLSRGETRAVAAELAKLADGKTVFVFSIDLSHYYPYDQAVALDRPCLAALERMDADEAARCTTDATQALLVMTELATILNLAPRLVTYANSGDVTGDRSRVVGYGAMAYEDRFDLGDAERGELLRLARRSMESHVRDGRDLEAPPELMSRFPRLGAVRGAFVTLKEHGELRGCVGTLYAQRPLAEDVAENAVYAAVRDNRFPPVSPQELKDIVVSVSALETPRPVKDPGADGIVSLLRQSKPGLILTYKDRRSTFLPEVWEDLPEPVQFLSHLCQKQGSPGDCWRDLSTRFETYGSLHFGEGP
jgi:AmmeMemoRadiSam system protein B/AmmeMemoRadiSam system protein A